MGRVGRARLFLELPFDENDLGLTGDFFLQIDFKRFEPSGMLSTFG